MIPENCDFATGFVSATFGTIPTEEPALNLPEKYSDWDILAAKLPDLINKNDLQSLQKNMSPISELEDKKHLARAALILGCCAHAYCFIARRCSLESSLPPSIFEPWREVCNKLGRKNPMLTMTDFVYHNWRYKNPTSDHSIDQLKSIENLELLVPVFNNQEERVSNLGIVVLEAHFAEIIQAISTLYEAKMKHDCNSFCTVLDKIGICLQNITRLFAVLFSSNKYSRYYINPDVWSVTFITFVRQTYETEPHLTGLQTLLFHILDALIGRNYNSYMGKHMHEVRKLFPALQIDFINKVEEMNVKQFVSESNDVRLKVNFMRLIESYSGERGLLEAHKKIGVFYSYMGLRNKSRQETNSGLKENNVFRVLQESIDERNEVKSIVNELQFTIGGCKDVGRGVFEVLLFCENNFHHFCTILPGSCIQIGLLNSETKNIELRTYSVNRVNKDGIYIMIEKQIYQNGNSGKFSTLLTDQMQINKTLMGKILPPLHFTLPRNINKRIILIAGGNGISPFIHFLEGLKAHGNNKGDSLKSVSVFLFSKNIDQFYPKIILDQFVAKFGLDIYYMDSKDGRKNVENEIRNVINKDAYIYVCGSIPFVTVVEDAMDSVLGNQEFCQMIANKQIVCEEFSIGGIIDFNQYLSGGRHPAGDLSLLDERERNSLFEEVHPVGSIVHAMARVGLGCPYSFFSAKAGNINEQSACITASNRKIETTSSVLYTTQKN